MTDKRPYLDGCGATLTETVGYPRTEYLRSETRSAEVTFVCSAHFDGLHFDERNGKRWPIEKGSEVPPLPLHRTEAGYPNCSTCDGGGCPDCTDLA